MVQLGIRSDHTYDMTIQVNVSNQRIHNGLYHNRMLYDIGENFIFPFQLELHRINEEYDSRRQRKSLVTKGRFLVVPN